MELDLILREIEETHTRENFSRLKRILTEQAILQGDWKLYEINLPTAVTGHKLKHNLKFIPYDIIQLSAVGDQNYQFRHELFTRTNMIIDADGPVVLRFLAGRYKDFGDDIRSKVH